MDTVVGDEGTPVLRGSGLVEERETGVGIFPSQPPLLDGQKAMIDNGVGVSLVEVDESQTGRLRLLQRGLIPRL